MPLRTIPRSHATLTLALGFLGAATLILGNWFVSSGPLLLLVYALVVVATTWLIRLERMSSYAERFLVGLGVFGISSLGLYVAVSLDPASSDSITVLGHAWRLGALLLIGAAVNLATARVAEAPEPERATTG